ncbi:hypothetical protein Q4519_14595, partial [Motilimonas sp. 1_MG-2023]|uniref:hypothetical protein n=1 Tax=Motilimonas sp. 1_MG-2023 TaxID=3062672 RepID=UPI0026E2045F
KDPAIREQALGYLTTAAKRGYAPAMIKIYNFHKYIGMDKAKIQLRHAMELGYAEGAFHLAFINEKLKNKTQENWEKIYKYYQLTDKLGGRTDHGYLKNKAQLPQAVVAILDQEITEFLTKVKPNRFYDETNLY